MSRKISLKICSALAAGAVIVSLGVACNAPEAAAATRHKHAALHRLHAAYARRDHRFARHAPFYGSVHPALPPNAVIGPGYVFVPGEGILGESCNMPTSTCSNEYRDVQ